jgi:dolichol-phosphate mannosyltransferase
MNLECALVMPAYNEQDCIGAVLSAWHNEFQRRFGPAFRIIVVNDGSRDQTATILDELATKMPELIVIHQPNAGHGAALMTGYRRALGLPVDRVFQTDSDDQFDPADFGGLWDQRNNSDFILGFRSDRHDPFHRLVITRILRFLVLAVFGVNVKDLNVPFRLIRASYLKALLDVLPVGLFAPNIFLSILAAADGQALKSIPVTHRVRRSGTVSIMRMKLLKVCIRSAGELISFRLNLRSTLARLRSHANQVQAS